MRLPAFLDRPLPADTAAQRLEQDRVNRFDRGAWDAWKSKLATQPDGTVALRSRDPEVERTAAAPSVPAPVLPAPERAKFDGCDELVSLAADEEIGQTVTVVAFDLPSRLPAPLSITEARRVRLSWQAPIKRKAAA